LSWAGSALGPLLDPEEHPSLHEEVGEFDENGVDDRGQAPADPAVGDDPATLRSERVDDDIAPVLDSQNPARFEHGHFEADLGVDLHLVTDLAVLPLGMDIVRIDHLAAGQILEPFVAVEAASVLP